MAKVITQHRRGTTAEWENSTVVIADGEIVIEMCDDGSRKTKIGDGVRTFANLPYTDKVLVDEVGHLKAVVDGLTTIQPSNPDDPDSIATLDSVQREVVGIRAVGDVTYESAGAAVNAIYNTFKDFKDAEAIDGLHYEDNILYLTANGGQILERTGVEIIGGSGGSGDGGGSSNGTVVSLINEVRDANGNKTTLLNAIVDSTVQLKFTFTSTIEGESTGNGTCYVTVNGISKVNNYKISNGVVTTLDISDYIVPGNNTVRVSCTDAYGTTRTLIYSISVLELALSSTFNSYIAYNSDIDFRYMVTSLLSSATIYFYITPAGGSRKLLAEKSFTSSISGKEQGQIIPIEGLSHGVTTLEVYAEAELDGAVLPSNTLKYDLIIALPNETAPMIASVLTIDKVNQGDQLSIPYVVYDPNTTESKVTVLLQTSLLTNGEYIVQSTSRVEVENTLSTWNTRNYPYGEVRFSILYYRTYDENGNGIGTPAAEKHHYVTVNESLVDVEAEQNPILYLTAVDKSNDAIDRDQWSYTNATSTITTDFEGFNWKSNGWLTDTEGNTILRVNGGAKATINYFPFANIDNALRNHGMTYEFEYAIRDLNDRTDPVIKCCDVKETEVTKTTTNEATGEELKITKTEKRVVGIQAFPDKVLFGSTQTNLTCTYKDNEKLRVSFVIDQNNDNSSRFISAYVDGTLTSVINYVSGTDFFANSQNIQIGGTGCTIDIYSIRIYDRALSAKEILNNYVADEKTVSTKLEIFTDNDVYDTYGRLSYEAIKARIPTITFTGEMPKIKDDKKIVKMDFVNPFDHSKDFSNVYGGPIDVEIDVQGTSSQYYVRKNWKFKLKKKDKTTGETIFDHAAYQHMDNEVPAKVFCVKVDYAEGTGTHNTQNANYAETLYTGKVPAQFDDSRVRTTICGFPCAIFERADDTSDPVFSSKGNFNFDKDAEEAFGFTEDYDVECWEFCNNVDNEAKFLNNIDPENWHNTFEPRCYYPKYTTKVDLDEVKDLQEKATAAAKGEGTITETELSRLTELRRTSIDRFKRMHDWVVSTTNDLDKFKNEFEQHFNLEYSLIYYIYTFVALMTDQRAKNMFLTYWGQRIYADESTKTWMIGNVDSKISAASAPPVPVKDETNGIEYFEVDGQRIIAGFWYPYLYDNDTCFGIDNSGNPVFDYYHEDIDTFEGATWDTNTNTWANGLKLVYNGQQSILWNNFRRAFSSQIADKYRELRSSNKLSYDAIYNQFIDEGAEKYSASIYNEDAEYKYLCMARPKGNGQKEDGTWNDPNVDNLYQVKGDGKHQLKYFLENRFKYCDSKWQANDYINDKIYLRINGTKDGAELDDKVEVDGGAADGTHSGYSSSIRVTPFSSMYCSVQYGAGSERLTERCNAGETCVFTYDKGSPNDLETTIFGASELSSIGDLSNLFISRITFDTPTKLTELKIGDSASTYKNSALSRLSLNNLPLLQTLNISNCEAIVGNIDCSKCNNIQEIYALGATSVSGVTLSNGGYVKTLYLPESITDLKLKSQHDLVYDGTYTYEEGYGFGIGSETDIDCKNIERLCIYDCPNVDSSLIFNKCISYDNTKLKSVRLDNIRLEADNWLDIRKYYLPKQSDVGAESTVGTSYFIGENGNYFKKNLNSTPTDTGIPASAGYGYGLAGIDENDDATEKPYLSGICVINQDMDGRDMAELVEYLPFLEFRTGVKEDGTNYKITSTIKFMNNAGTQTVYEDVIESTSTKDVTYPDPVKNGSVAASAFNITSSVKYDYTLNGWSRNPETTFVDGVPRRTPQVDALTNIIGNRVLYPTYSANIRYYPFEFYNEAGDTLLHRVERAKYYENDSDYVVYPNEDPIKEGVENPELYPFSAWNPAPIVTEENLALNDYECVKVYAVFKTIDAQWEIPTITELNYTTSGNTLAIQGRTAQWSDEPNVFVKIPEDYTVSGTTYTVDSLRGFNNFAELQLLELPETLTKLPYTLPTGLNDTYTNYVGALQNCDKLEEITIPKNIKDLGCHTFADCLNLKKINYCAEQASANEWYDAILTGSGQGELEVTIDSGVKALPNYALSSVSSTRGVIDKLIWSDANSCSSIGSSAFQNTQINKSVIESTDPNGDRLFTDSNVFTLPEGLTTVNNLAFAECNSTISKIQFPQSLTTIGQSAFKDWSSLHEFNIPKNVTISSGAFVGCSNVENIDIEENPKYEFRDGCLIVPETNTLLFATSAYNLTEIPSGITVVAENAFNSNKLTLIDLNGVLKVESQAFMNCNNLETVLMTNDTVQSIGSQSFYNCVKLKNVTLSSNIVKIPSFCFYGTAIENIKIPTYVQTIDESAFKRASSLVTVEFMGSNITSIANGAFSNCSSLTDISIPSSVTTLGDCVFDGCSNLTHVTLPTRIETIYGETFRGCSSLTSVTIPDSVKQILNTGLNTTSVNNGAFTNCSSLEEVVLGGSITASNISNVTFTNCSKLTSIKTKLSQEAFGTVPANKWGATNATIEYNYVEA